MSAAFVPQRDPRPDDVAWPQLSWPVAADTVLSGGLVELTPVDSAQDASELFSALDHDAVWAHVSARPRSVDDFRARIAGNQAGSRQQWTMRLRAPYRGLAAQSVIGSTSYLDAQPGNASVEIGSTTYTPAVWGSAVNPETKLLLLGHAFDVLNAGRVFLKTDIRNERSQRAIERLGAQYEGVLRRHMRRDDGTVRDTVMFSIIAEEWPRVRDGLKKRVEEAVAAE